MCTASSSAAASVVAASFAPACAAVLLLLQLRFLLLFVFLDFLPCSGCSYLVDAVKLAPPDLLYVRSLPQFLAWFLLLLDEKMGYKNHAACHYLLLHVQDRIGL